MAVVVITDTVIYEVQENIKKLFKPRLDEAKKVPDHWFDMIYNGMFAPELLEVMGKLPKGYLTVISNITVRGYKGGLNDIQQHAVTLYAPSGKSYWTVAGVLTAQDNNVVANYNNNLELLPTAPFDDFGPEYIEYCNTINGIVAETEAYVVRAKTMLRSRRTLSPILKEWPSLWELLSEDVKRRHKTVTERAKMDPSDIPVLDMSGITAQLTANRLIGNVEKKT